MSLSPFVAFSWETITIRFLDHILCKVNLTIEVELSKHFSMSVLCYNKAFFWSSGARRMVFVCNTTQCLWLTYIQASLTSHCGKDVCRLKFIPKNSFHFPFAVLSTNDDDDDDDDYMNWVSFTRKISFWDLGAVMKISEIWKTFQRIVWDRRLSLCLLHIISSFEENIFVVQANAASGEWKDSVIALWEASSDPGLLILMMMYENTILR